MRRILLVGAVGLGLASGCADEGGRNPFGSGPSSVSVSAGCDEFIPPAG